MLSWRVTYTTTYDTDGNAYVTILEMEFWDDGKIRNNSAQSRSDQERKADQRRLDNFRQRVRQSVELAHRAHKSK